MDKQKIIVGGLIIYFLLITVFTFTGMNLDFSHSIGVKVEGTYSQGIFIPMRSGHFSQPQYGAYIAYIIIGIIIGVGLMKLTVNKKD